VSNQGNYVVGVAIDVVGRDPRWVVASAVSAMIEEDLLEGLRQRGHVAGRAPKLRVSSSAQMEYNRAPRSLDLVMQPCVICRPEERHAQSLGASFRVGKAA